MGRFARLGNDLYSGRRQVQFVERRWTWYYLAIGLSVLSIGSVLTLGLNPGIEFRGGSEYRLAQVTNTSSLLGSEAVASVAPDSQALVTQIGTDGVRVQTERLTSAQTDQVKAALAEAYDVPVDSINATFVGPSWGQDVSQKAIQGLVVFLILVALVIGAYFRTWTMAVAALVALMHDLLITVGVYALVGFEVTPATVIGFLTILGYSLYDTVVVFDKVRENTERITSSSRRTFAEAANLAINQTLVRSINTSVVALLPVASILFIGAFILGAGTLRDISLALFVGIAAGTYSSIFVATPLLVDLRKNEPEILAHTRKLERRREAAASKQAEAGHEPGHEPGAVDGHEDVPSAEVGAGVSAGVGVGLAAGGSGAGGSGAGGSGAGGSGVPAGSGGPARAGQGGQRRQPRRNAKGRNSGQRR